MSDLTKEYRIVVCIDVEASSPEDAYSKVYDMMMKIEPSQAWESSDEWYDEDGELIDELRVSQARLEVLKNKGVISDVSTPSEVSFPEPEGEEI
jgi:hypothetical protein